MFPRGAELNVLTLVGTVIEEPTKVSLNLLHESWLALNLVHNKMLEQVAALESTPL